MIAVGKLNAQVETPQGVRYAVRVGVATGLAVVGDLIGAGSAEEEKAAVGDAAPGGASGTGGPGAPLHSGRAARAGGALLGEAGKRARAALSLARLQVTQGDEAGARAQLQDIYDWFTEGFETADLIAAKALLAALGRSTP